ncbi:MAG: trigger factor, partial [Burkholderiaceae bacterium]
AADRAAQDDDRVTIDFVGRLDGEPFDGGTADDFQFVIGEGRMLSDFENGVRGKASGETVTFPVAFPEDYSAAELAGKTAEFEVTVKAVEQPRLPEVDDEFAKTLGVADGSLETMRADIRANLEREVRQRLRARTKNSVMEALRGAVEFELPKALVSGERDALIERAKADMQARGMKVDDLPIPDDMFVDQAEQRVRLGLIVAEIVKNESLSAKPDQLRAMIEEFAQAYENPAEVVRHYFSSRERLGEIEAMVIEQNVVDWVLENAQVEDESLAFDELMSGG